MLPTAMFLTVKLLTGVNKGVGWLANVRRQALADGARQIKGSIARQREIGKSDPTWRKIPTKRKRPMDYAAFMGIPSPVRVGSGCVNVKRISAVGYAARIRITVRLQTYNSH